MPRLAAILCLLLVSGLARADDKVVFRPGWKAATKYGGYCQAIATGIAGHGLDVTIRQGAAQVNHARLLPAGRLDFNSSPNAFLGLNFVMRNIPFRAVAEILRKDPVHPETAAERAFRRETRVPAWYRCRG